MSSRQRAWITGIALVAGAAGLFTWGRHWLASETPDPGGELTFRPDAAQREKLAELEKQVSVEHPHFSREVVRDRDSAKLFMYLAGTSEKEAVVDASLEAILSAYSSRSGKKEAPDADLDRVLIQHLTPGQPARLRLALQAARIPLMSPTPSAALVGAIANLAAPGQASNVRHVALEALDLLPPSARNPRALSTFVAALDAEPHLQALALFALTQSARSLPSGSPELTRVAEGATRLTEAADPGVRGRALGLLGALQRQDPGVDAAEKAREKLADPHPYVRAVALDVLGAAGSLEDLAAVLPLTEDFAGARYELTGFQALDGAEGRLSFVVPGRKLVAEAALHALVRLSTPLGDERYSVGGPLTNEAQARAAAERAEAWYAGVKDRLPASAL